MATKKKEEMSIRLLNADEIECRVGQCGKTAKGSAWCSILLYKDARCDQRILDELFGIFGWQKDYQTINGELYCTVKVKDPETGEWVCKQDVGTESNTEAVKGRASDAFKRASFNLGIGRELYTAPKIFINLGEKEVSESAGKVKLSPKVVFDVAYIHYSDKRVIDGLLIKDNGGNVRYKYGEVPDVKEERKAVESPETEPTRLSVAINEVMGTTTQEECKAVCAKYADLQSNPEFKDAAYKKFGELKKTA